MHRPQNLVLGNIVLDAGDGRSTELDGVHLVDDLDPVSLAVGRRRRVWKFMRDELIPLGIG